MSEPGGGEQEELACRERGQRRQHTGDNNTGLLLVDTDHVTWILTCDWLTGDPQQAAHRHREAEEGDHRADRDREDLRQGDNVYPVTSLCS